MVSLAYQAYRTADTTRDGLVAYGDGLVDGFDE